MKNVVVTGGAGFVGSHLCEELVSRGYNVTSIDNYFTGTVDNHVSGVNYITGETNDIEDLLSGMQIDMIYHLGEYSRVEQSFNDIEFVTRFNVIGTLAVLEYVRKNKHIKLLYAGSSTKYSDIGCDSSPYSWSKANNTKLVKQYGEWFGIDYCITYFYNVYGGREISIGNYSTVVAKYKKLYQNKEALPVTLPGTQLRNFTHISDIISGLVLVGENGSGDEYGIGADQSYSVLELAKMFGDNIVYKEQKRGNRLQAELVTSKTKELGWTPKVNLKEHIQDFCLELN